MTTNEQFLAAMRVLHQPQSTLRQRTQWLIVAVVWFVAIVAMVVASLPI